jgi:F0F1-type ATP synthase membrane subunit c/vacuolar-type H+-ATPase subunit K
VTTDLSPTSSPTLSPTGATPAQRARGRVVRTLATGLFGGLLLGIVARAWMRLIAEDPEFTWNGTIFIVAGFTIFGLTQSLVVIAHRRRWRPVTLTIARFLGTIGMLPLFVAAGAVMMPTVVGAGLASARREWRPVTRSIWLLAASVPVVLVGKGFVDSFGWSVHALAGFAAMLGVYATIVRAARSTFSARPDGRRLPRWARVGALVVVALAFLFFTAGAIFQ